MNEVVLVFLEHVSDAIEAALLSPSLSSPLSRSARTAPQGRRSRSRQRPHGRSRGQVVSSAARSCAAGEGSRPRSGGHVASATAMDRDAACALCQASEQSSCFQKDKRAENNVLEKFCRLV